MLYLSILANIYISGLAAVMQQKVLPSRRDLSSSRDTFQLIYVVLSAIIMLCTLVILRAERPEDFALVLAPRAADWWPQCAPWLFVLLAFGLQITFDAVYLILYSRRQSERTVYRAPRQNMVLTLLVGTLEEISYRVIILHSLLLLGLPVLAALLLSSLLYVLNHMHMILNSERLKVYWFLSRLLLGLLLGLTALKGGVLYAMALHAGYNLYIMLAVPYFSRRYAHA